MRFVKARDGLALATYEYNNLSKSSTSILFSHATGFHGRVFLKTIAALNKHHSVTLDHRGHGKSQLNNVDEHDWNIFGMDIDSVGDQITNGIIGVGHSMGATSLIMSALKSPKKYRGLILFEPIVFPWEFRFGSKLIGDSPLSRLSRKRRKFFSSKEEAVNNFASKPPMNAFDRDVLEAYVEHGIQWDINIGVNPLPATPSTSAPAPGPFPLSCNPEYEATIYNGGAKHTLWRDLGQIPPSVPVWVLAGKHAPLSPSALAPRIASRIPNAKFVCWEDASHFGPLEHPLRLAEFIENIVNELDSTPSSSQISQAI